MTDTNSCPICNGEGYVVYESQFFDYETLESCINCDGEGYIEEKETEKKAYAKA